MFFFTHLFIADVLYQQLHKEVELDRRAFIYGNIKPDLPSTKRVHHTLDHCLTTVCVYSNELMNTEKSIKDFSLQLGEICHYVSDFFCYYHLNEELHNKNCHHFFYEIRLHMELYLLGYKKKHSLLPLKKEPTKNINSIIFKMRKSYYTQPKCLKRDIDYALFVSTWICESIIYFYHYSSDLVKEFEQTLDSFYIVEEGNL